MSDLVHCIYASTATRDMCADDLVVLLARARVNNAALGVTGMLLHDRGNFFQVLEGPERVVAQLYAHIATDPRHHRVVEIIHEPIARRSFSAWTMGFARLDEVDRAQMPGLNDFFEAGHTLNQIDGGRAKKLLQAFSAGRWHRRVQVHDEQPV
jgi:Sensors of blue-light using FAD